VIGAAVNHDSVNDGQFRLTCSQCQQTLAFAEVDETGAITYHSVRPVSYRFLPGLVVQAADGTQLQGRIEDWCGSPGYTGPAEQTRIRFRKHRRCRSTPTVAEAWLDQQVCAAMAAGQSSVSLG
jgi:hypothetical protein